MSFFNYSSRTINCKIVVFFNGMLHDDTFEKDTVKREFAEWRKRLRPENRADPSPSGALGALRIPGEIRGFTTQYWIYATGNGKCMSSALMQKGLDAFVLWHVLPAGEDDYPEATLVADSAEESLAQRGYEAARLPGLTIWSRDAEQHEVQPSPYIRTLGNPMQLPEFSCIHGRPGDLTQALKLLVRCILAELRRGT